MKQTIIVTRGIPAAGKTTWSKEYINNNPNTIRVNRDDIRNMLTPNFIHGGDMESLVTSIEHHTIRKALSSGYSIIIDATNFKGTGQFTKIADQLEIEYELIIKRFETTLEECILRDSKREKPIGEEVIRKMYNKHK